MLKFGRHVEQTDAIKVHYGRGSEGKAGQFSQFLKKKYHFNVI